MKKEKNFFVVNCENEIDVIANKVESYGIQRFKISILNTEFDCKKIKLINADDRYCYTYIFSDGQEKIGRTRDEVENYIGHDNLLFAEKQIEKNIRAMNKKLRENLKHPVMVRLSSEVEKHVKFYKSDFYHWDNYFIFKHNIRKFIIVLRESGTHLLPLKSDINYSDSNRNMIDYFRKNDDNSRKYFLCDMDDYSVKQITLNDVIQYIQ